MCRCSCEGMYVQMCRGCASVGVHVRVCMCRCAMRVCECRCSCEVMYVHMCNEGVRV